MEKYTPQIGDVVFVNHKDSFISKLFSKIMASKWSHSAIVFDINKSILLLETNDYCVCPNYLERYFFDKNCTIQILRRPSTLSDFEKDLLIEQGKPLIGLMYGYLQLLTLSLRLLLKRKIRNAFRQGLVCCHVIGYCFQGIDSPIRSIDPESFDTEELYQLLNDSWITVYEKRV